MQVLWFILWLICSRDFVQGTFSNLYRSLGVGIIIIIISSSSIIVVVVVAIIIITIIVVVAVAAIFCILRKNINFIFFVVVMLVFVCLQGAVDNMPPLLKKVHEVLKFQLVVLLL